MAKEERPELSRALDMPLVEHLRIEYGQRVVGFLRTAQDLLDSGLESPRLGEAVAYCLREAIGAILDSSSISKGGWNKVSREVVGAFEPLVGVRDLTSKSARGAFEELATRIKALEQFHQQASVADQQLDEILIHRTGFGPTPQARRRFKSLWERLNRDAHGDATIEDAQEMALEGFAVLRQIFMPPKVRHVEIERLAQISRPSRDDHSQVVELLGRPNDQRAFFEKVSSLAWFPLLYESGHLYPSKGERMWPLTFALRRFAADYPDETKDWIERLYTDRGQDPIVAETLLRTCTLMGEPGLGVVLQVVKDHPKQNDFVMFAASAVGEFASPKDQLVEEFADEILNREQVAWRDFKPLLKHFADGADRSNAARRIELICNKLRTVDPLDLDRFEVDIGGSVADVAQDPPYHSRAGVLMASLIEVLERARESLSSGRILDALQRLPSSLSRVSSWVLAESLGDDCVLSVAEVEKAIGARFPTGDDLRLIVRILEQCEPSLYINPWRDALGPAPTIEEVGRALSTYSIPRDWLRKRAWVALLPPESALNWSTTCDILESRYGQIARDDFDQPRAQVKATIVPSPISAEELGSLNPETAASRVEAWRPDQSAWPPAGAHELAHALRSVVAENPGEWVSNPLRIVTRLRHPTYVNAYLSALATAGSDHELPVDALLDVIQFVRTHPWEAEGLGSRSDFDDYDRDWRGTEQAAANLVRTLADSDADFGDRSEEVWDFLEAEVANKPEPSLIVSQSSGYDPHQSAINRPCTRALETVIHLLASECRRSGTVSTSRAIALFEPSLQLTGTDGAEHRSILAPRIEFFRDVLPEWTEEHLDLFFGSEAPDGLGQISFDECIKWSQPKAWLLKRYRKMLRDAVRRKVERALDFMLIAMFWNTPGYSIKENINFLAQHPDLVSPSGRIVARVARESDIPPPEHLRIAEEFWRAALKTGAPLGGFGWYSEVKALSDDTWAELTLRTLRKSHNRVQWGKGVIERLLTIPPTVTTLKILRLLVQEPSNELERVIIAKSASDFLCSAQDLNTTDEYHRLQTTFRERRLIKT